MFKRQRTTESDRLRCLGRYFPNLAYSLGCLNGLVSLSHAARPTTLPKSWSLCFRRRPLSNSSRYSTLSCSIYGSETQPVAAKRCSACVLMKSFRALSARAQSIGQKLFISTQAEHLF